nr:MAG TPA: Pre-mRNA-splicing factor 8, U4/U6 small, assembly, pre-B complex, U1 [Caudoviricetes sp.]
MGRRGKGYFGGLGRGATEGRVGRWETGIGFDFESFSLESYLGI